MTENRVSPKTLDVLISTIAEEDLVKVLNSLLSSAGSIAKVLRNTGGANAVAGQTTNSFGDEQLEADVAADDLIREGLAATNAVRVVSSEENAVEMIQNETATLSVAYDPLDGSSIIPTNFAVGTIVGVWRAPTFLGTDGNAMTAALAVVYGPRTTVFIATRAWGRGVTEAQLRDDGSWKIVRQSNEIAEGKLFAPANLRCTADNPGYRRLVDWYISQRYTLRYTGGMVPDVIQILVKGYGVFLSPVSQKAPAKLRLVYEAMPMAFLVVQGGGCSSDGTMSVLKRTIRECEERTGICLGSAGEVNRFEQFCREGTESEE